MTEQSWRTPPDPIDQILSASPTPTVSFSPTRHWFLELERPSLCPIAELAAPEVAVAGFRLNPQTNSPARSNPYRRLWITEIATGLKRSVPLPDPALISFLCWSPDGQKLAFTLTQSNGLELWVMELAAGKPWRVTEPILNGRADLLMVEK
jgi:dipeptidyl aminopeptidase/acylaminoacyl peptidase